MRATNTPVMAARVAKLLETLPTATLPVLLVFPFPVEAEVVHGLLRHPAVAACLVPTENLGAFAGDKRVGEFAGRDVWRLPGSGARTVVYLGQSSRIRPRRLFDAMQAGMRRVMSMDSFGAWHRVGIIGWYGRYLAYRWRESLLLAGPLRRLLPEKWWDQLQERRALRHLRTRRIPGLPEPEAGKVLLISDSLGPGGAERQVVHTALGIAEKGRRVVVACVNRGRPEFDFYRPVLETSVPLDQTNDLAELLLRSPDKAIRDFVKGLAARGIRQLLKPFPERMVDDIIALAMLLHRQRPAVVHLWQDYTNLVGGLAAILAGVPRIILGSRSLAAHHAFYHQPYMRYLYRVLLRQPGVSLLSNSQAGANSYADWLDIPPDAVGVVHNAMPDLPSTVPTGTRRSRRLQYGIPPEARVVGGVFRCSEEKGPLLWLDTAARVAERYPDAHFLIAGDGPMRAQMLEHADTLGISERLHMPGQQQDVVVPLSTMDVLLLASRIEGLPNVLIEAQAMGCPVVTTDVGGCGETLQQGETGWRVAERSAQALAERVLAVLDDEQWRATAHEKAPRLMAERFGRERMIADTLAVYGCG